LTGTWIHAKTYDGYHRDGPLAAPSPSLRSVQRSPYAMISTHSEMKMMLRPRSPSSNVFPNARPPRCPSTLQDARTTYDVIKVQAHAPLDRGTPQTTTPQWLHAARLRRCRPVLLSERRSLRVEVSWHPQTVAKLRSPSCASSAPDTSRSWRFRGHPMACTDFRHAAAAITRTGYTRLDANADMAILRWYCVVDSTTD